MAGYKPFAVTRALEEANADIIKDIDGIAVTRGPGMPGCLSVGMNASKTMAAVLKKPFVGVHHMVWPMRLLFRILSDSSSVASARLDTSSDMRRIRDTSIPFPHSAGVGRSHTLTASREPK